MKKSLLLLLLIVSAVMFTARAQTAEEIQKLQEAEQAYTEGDYARAIRSYEQVASSGKEAFGLFYNLGNAYYKKGDIPSAILNYEKARKLKPEDEDLLHNLAAAQRQTVDEIEAVPDLLVSQWYRGFVNSLHSDVWIGLSTASFWLLLLALGLFFYKTSRAARKTWLGLALVFVLLSGIFFTFGYQQRNYVLDNVEAIVFEPSVTVKSMPAKTGTSLFVLHEGTKVKVLEQNNDWARIRLADGNVGWLPLQHIRKI